MGLLRYSFDGSSLSGDERLELIHCLEQRGYTGCIVEDIKNGKYQAFLEEGTDTNLLPLPVGTIVRLIP